MPTVLDPDDASGPAGFGPLSPRWAGRRRLLRQLDPTILDAAVPELPDAFAWSYFQAAPPDQRCAFLNGDEWVVLDNLWRGLARIESRLPGGRGAARVYDGQQHVDVPLVADTLFIDANRGVCSLVWRGNVAVDPSRLQSMEVLAGLELPGRPIPWPGGAAQPRAEGPAMASAAAGAGSAPPPAPAPAPTPESAYAYSPAAPQEQAYPQQNEQAYPQQPPPMTGYEAQTLPTPEHDLQPHGAAHHEAQQAQRPPSEPPQQQAPQQHVSQPTPASGQHAVPSPRSPSGSYQAVARNPTGSHQAVGAADPGRAPMPSYGMRYPTPTPGSQPAARTPTSPPIEPPPPPTVAHRSEDDDGGHTVMRQVDARLLQQLSAVDGPTTVGRTPLPLAAIPAAPGAYDDRNESTALFSIPADTTLMRIARGDAPSPMSQAFAASARAQVDHGDASLIAESVVSQAAVSQAETARRPTAEHELVDEQTFVHDDAEIQRLLADSTAVSSRGQNAEQTVPSSVPPVSEGPATQQAGRATAPPPTMATPATVQLPDAARRQLRATSRGLGPVHVMEASAVGGDDAEPAVDPAAPVALATTTASAGGSMAVTRPGKDSMKQALRDELMRRLMSGQSLADAHLENADLSDLDLSGQNLSRALLRGARFDRSRLDGADLTGARLEGAQLAGVSLTGASLVGANLDGAVLDGAQLLSAALDDASLVGASLIGVIMVDATGTRASFRDAELRDAKFDRSRLRGADFERARLTNATFLSTDLAEASFFEAAGNSASFVEATLTGARFDQSHFALARFARAAATDTLWNEAVLDGASFEAASLTGASFAKASCQGAIFSSADLTEARFQRAGLDGAVFTGADIEGAVFDSPDGPSTGPMSTR